MRTIAVVNQKGGCGKTTISINLASSLAEAGKRILLVDMDPQSHCAVGLAVPEEQIEQSIYDVLISRSRNEPIRLAEMLWQISDRLELAPASIDLAAFEQQMSGIGERETCLRQALEQVKGEYDYSIIDCPPAVSLLTFNALTAATDVIVPVETGYFALHGLSKQLETLRILCERCSQRIDVKILASMYDIRTKMAREILSELRAHFADRMFNTVVNFNTKIKEASSFGQPINEYDPASKGHKDFRMLAEEVIGAEAKQQRRQMVNSLAGQLESISASANELLKATKPEIKTVPAAKTPQPRFVVEEAIGAEAKQQSRQMVNSRADQIESVSVSANELLKVTKPEIKAVPPAKTVQPQFVAEEAEETIDAEAGQHTVQAQQAITSTKLSYYYGVNQLDDAIAFVTLYPRAQSVQVAGDFNNWQPVKTSMERVGESGIWQTKIKLPRGKYRYRLVVDGQWQQDPYNELTELNPFGEFNSVIEVK
jgi:chromosome partitioning protein